MENPDKIAPNDDNEYLFISAQLFNKLPDAVVVIDDDGKIKYLNDELENMTGYHRSELHGQAIETLVPEDLREMHVRHRNLYNEEPRQRAMGTGLILNIRRKNGKLIPVEINLSPLPTPWGPRYIAAIRRKRDSEAKEPRT